MKFTASGHESPQAAQFRVAVDKNGAVRYCFLERSSGDAGLDEQARKYLVLYRLSAVPNPNSEAQNDFVWGTATFDWGNDIVAVARATESVAP
ncbi:MAG TPA: TonB C-terminal domain-containing protein [Chthoniobacterales bacterium]|nr:TonB C-terminal domain-containing protein [Chthoniobacterales bacterium]